MDCEKFDRVVLDLLYQELEDIQASAARRHLEHCTRCRKIENELRATRSAGRLPLTPAPEGLETLMIQAERQTNQQLPLRRRAERAVSIMAGYAMRPQLAMAALLLLLIGSSLLFLRGQPGNQERMQVTERGVPGNDLDSLAVVPRQGELGTHGLDSPGAQAPQGAHTIEPDLEAAWAAYYGSRYNEALERAEVVARAGGERAAEAALLVAQALRKQSGCQAAVSRFSALHQRFAGTNVGSDAGMQAADCYRALGDRELARRIYEGLMSQPAYRERSSAALAELRQETSPPTRPALSNNTARKPGP